jgi:hypothetical protein
MSSIEHIRSTPGYPDDDWPPLSGLSLDENLADLRGHADDFARNAGYTFTVLDPGDDDVTGCVYLYPSASEEWTSRCSRGCGPTGRASTEHLPTPSHDGSPPTGSGSGWTAAVADRRARRADRRRAPVIREPTTA